MIQMGRVKGNKMVNMQLTNAKLVDRGSRMVSEELGLPYDEAKRLLFFPASVKVAFTAYRSEHYFFDFEKIFVRCFVSCRRLSFI